ncbi:MAG: hypothetical protein H0U81_10940 [Pyrinomonadaceae bacterium]|nr:hypothetical protein [Pyrinomonadaceae bacterium]
MNLLPTLFLLFNQSGSCPQNESPSVRISAMSQTVFENRGHHPENNRRVVFRLINESSKPVIVYGFKFDGEFDPTGYMMSVYKENGEWEYPHPSNRPTEWGEVSPELKSKRVLKPGTAITFIAEMSIFEVGSRFRRTVYLPFNERDVPCEIRGEEFVLK